MSILLVVLVISCGPPPPTPTPAPTPTPVKVTSRALFQHYFDDEVSAEYEYQGKVSEMTGEIRKKTKKEGVYEISLEGDGVIGEVVCKVSALNVRAAEAKIGRVATVRGRVIGVPGCVNVVVQPCTVLD